MNPTETDYATLVSVRNLELQMLWTRFNLHLLINGGILVAYLSAGADSHLKLLTSAVPAFGIILCALWLISERAGRYTLSHFDSRLGAFEDSFWKDSDFKDYRFFSDVPCELKLQSYVSICVIMIFVLAWIFLLSTKCTGCNA